MSRHEDQRAKGVVSLHEEALNAARYLQGVISSQAERGLAQGKAIVGYFPVARTNPFQGLLYRSLWNSGIAPIGLYSEEELGAVGQVQEVTGCATAVHLHWTSPVLKDVENREEAGKRVNAFLDLLDGLADNGTDLVWTVHNILPHACTYPEEEALLRQGIAWRAGLIHVMNMATVDAVSGFYQLPLKKVAYVGHPSYEGAYRNVISRHAARFELGLDPDDVVVGFVGSIQEYKGVKNLVEAYERLELQGEGRRLRLVIAGQASGSELAERLEDRCAGNVGIDLHLGKIPDNEMQVYLNAVDVIVLPYEHVLNSGVALLAASFGTPVIAPDVPSLREVLGEKAAGFFRAGDIESLAGALARSGCIGSAQRRQAANEVSRRLAPSKVSRAFAEELATSGLLSRGEDRFAAKDAGGESGKLYGASSSGGPGFGRVGDRGDNVGRRPVVGLVGYFGWGNFGDELFVRVLRSALEGEFEVRILHDLQQPPYFSSSAWEAVEDVDAIVIGGGDLLVPWNVSELYWRREYLSRPVFIVGVGVPTWGEEDRAVVEQYKEFLNHENVKFVWTRDLESLNWIQDRLGSLEKAWVAPDLACATELPDASRSEALFGVAVRKRKGDDDYTQVRELCRRAEAVGYKLRKVVLGVGDVGARDAEVTRNVGLDGAEIVKSESLDGLLRAIGECSAFASMKFHGCLMAAMYGVPSIVLMPTDKNRNLMRMIGREDLLSSLNSSSLPDKVAACDEGIDPVVVDRLRRRARGALDRLKEDLLSTVREGGGVSKE